MVSACKPSNAKLTLFAKLNYLPSCLRTTKQTAQCQSVGERLQKCEAFSIVRLVAEKSYFEVGELNICRPS